ncbi:MAG: hypothetical protein ACTSRR_03215 [Candidatus Heimdallarchaeaceae archaeon]
MKGTAIATSKFQGKNQAIYSIKKDDKITLYCAFIIRPKKKEVEKKGDYEKKTTIFVTDTKSLFLPLNIDSSLKIMLHRFILPAKLRKITKEKNKGIEISRKKEESEEINVFLTYYIFKISKTYDLTVNLLSMNTLLEDFAETVRSNLKELFLSLGAVGRITGELLEKIVCLNVTDKSSIINNNSKEFLTELAKEFVVIEKSTEIQSIFLPGPSVDLRTSSVFFTPSRIESAFPLGKTEEGFLVGFPPSFSYPILLCGDKKIRNILLSKILENSSAKFIVLGEINGKIRKKNVKLSLGENFTFNILSPMFMRKVLSERDYWRYLSDFLLIVKEVTEVRNENLLQIPEIIKFYIQEYEQSEDNLFTPFDYSSVTIDDIYTMLTSEPGGLIISDYQLAALRSVFTDISDNSVSTVTNINGKHGIEALIDQNHIIDFSKHSIKVRKIFVYSLLLQLYLYFQTDLISKPVIVVIDNAELFFSTEVERTFISKLLTLFESLPVNIILSTSFPSHLALTAFDLTNNRIIANLRSAKCAKLIADSHNLLKEQKEMLLRLPQNSFLILREDFFEKPFLAYLQREDLNLFSNSRRFNLEKLDSLVDIGNTSAILEDENRVIEPIFDEEDLLPIMIDILRKLDSKAQRGINSESLVNLFPDYPAIEVKNAVKLLELRGLIFRETVDKEGRKGEFWTKISPLGKKMLSRFEIQSIAKNDKIDKVERKEEEITILKNEQSHNEKISNKKQNNGKKDSLEQSEVINHLEKVQNNLKNSRNPVDAFLDSIMKVEKKAIQIFSRKGKKIGKISDFYILLHDFIQKAKAVDFNIQSELKEFEQYLNSLYDVLEDSESLEQMSDEILERVMRKGLNLLDQIHVKCSFDKIERNSSNLPELLEKELNSDKWENIETKFDDEVVSDIKHNIKNDIQSMFLTDSEKQVFQVLNHALEAPKDSFIDYARKAIARLMKIKMQFYPNLDDKEFIIIFVRFFEKNQLPIPFNESILMVDELAFLSTISKQKKKEIIAKIIEENNSFVFDLDDKSKDSLVIQLKEIVSKSLRKLKEE